MTLNQIMTAKKLVLAFALSLGCFSIAVASPENITDGELALTPPYCQDVQVIRWGDQYGANASPRASYWVEVMGKTFWAMHHYCWGLIEVHRSRAAGVPRQTREYMLDSAISDYYYVVKNAPTTFVLLPEIYVRIGEAQALKRDPVKALEAFASARQSKPDYWPAYVRAAEVLVTMGRKGDAKGLLAEGLRLMPAEPALKSAFERLGGKLSEVPQSGAVSVPASAPAVQK